MDFNRLQRRGSGLSERMGRVTAERVGGVDGGREVVVVVHPVYATEGTSKLMVQ